MPLLQKLITDSRVNYELRTCEDKLVAETVKSSLLTNKRELVVAGVGIASEHSWTIKSYKLFRTSWHKPDFSNICYTVQYLYQLGMTLCSESGQNLSGGLSCQFYNMSWRTIDVSTTWARFAHMRENEKLLLAGARPLLWPPAV